MASERIVQFHLAGHTDCGTHIIDTHDGHVIDRVWELYRLAYQRTAGVATLLEWDSKIPEFPVLHAEILKARSYIAEAAPLADTRGWAAERTVARAQARPDMFAGAHPPLLTVPELDQLADAFPQHLAQTRPAADAATGAREGWPDFIIDLAWLEWAFLKVYDGPGVEGQPDALDLLALPTEQLLVARPTPAPCLRLFTFRYPVHSYWRAVRRGEQPQLPAPNECCIAMIRRNYRVVLHEIPASQYAILQALDGQHTIGQLLARDVDARDRAPDIATLRDWLGEWVAKGFFASVILIAKQTAWPKYHQSFTTKTQRNSKDKKYPISIET